MPVIHNQPNASSFEILFQNYLDYGVNYLVFWNSERYEEAN